MMPNEELDNSYADEGEPVRVIPISRLKDNLEAFMFFLEGFIAKRVPVRLASTGIVHNGMGNASGNGYGVAIYMEGKLHFRYGDWSTKEGEESSNYHELNDLVVSMKNLYEKGLLKDCEVFIFIDNLVADCSYYKGSSSSRALFLLVLRLRKNQMAGDMIIHLIHITGKRMIASGIDGLSIGVYNKEVMSGVPMLNFLPLHLSAYERSLEMIPWIKSCWSSSDNLDHHCPNDWDGKVFLKGNFIWTPSPASGEATLEQLCRNVYLHNQNFHVIFMPRLMTSRWRKQILKVSDLCITIPFDSIVWLESNFEPLILAIFLRFFSLHPWKLKNTKLVRECERNFQEVWKDYFLLGKNLLRELLQSARTLESMPGCLVREVLSFSGNK